MEKVFVKQAELGLENGGYLVANGKPVYNEDFVAAQKHAEYVCLFAEKSKGKDFIGKEADDLIAFKKEVLHAMVNTNKKAYISVPEEPLMETKSKLASEAMAWHNHQIDKTKVNKMNSFLARFDAIAKFEAFGLYFEHSEIVELNKIYTMEEIIAATKAVVDLID